MTNIQFTAEVYIGVLTWFSRRFENQALFFFSVYKTGHLASNTTENASFGVITILLQQPAYLSDRRNNSAVTVISRN